MTRAEAKKRGLYQEGMLLGRGARLRLGILLAINLAGGKAKVIIGKEAADE